MSKFNHALTIYREEGLKCLSRRALKHFSLELNRNIAIPLKKKYWNFRGTQQFKIVDVEAEFDATDIHGGDALRGHFESEYEVVESFVKNLQPDDVVFDVGSHLGLYTCFAANALMDGEVIAFEPFPPNLVNLLRNISRNAESNVTVVGGALADADGLIPIESPTMTEDYGSPSITQDGSGSLAMASFTGDGLIESGSVPRPTVVKIDVEGAEGLVIDGLSETLARDTCRRIYCELHPPASHRSDVTDYNDTVPAVLNQIRELGFTIETKHERGTDLQVIGVKK